jgi:hypothetical protein
MAIAAIEAITAGIAATIRRPGSIQRKSGAAFGPPFFSR